MESEKERREIAQKQSVLDDCVDFLTDMKKHFNFETKVVLPAIILGMKSKKLAVWALSVEREHGALVEQWDAIMHTLLDDEPSLSGKPRAELADRFDRFRELLLQHSIEEDGKFEDLIRQNAGVQNLMMRYMKDQK